MWSISKGLRPFQRTLSRCYHANSHLRHDKKLRISHSRGVNLLHDPLLSKGTGFTMAERERLSIRGLVPPKCQEMEKQLLRVKRNLDNCGSSLDKFVFLAALHDRNETLFYKLVMDHIEELAGIIYTPTVGIASQRSHSLYRRPRGMYFSTQDRGQMSSMAYNWPQDEVDVIVVTDGSRILGLGDLGSNGMEIPIGKLSLYVAAGGIRPRAVLPVVLDVGTNNESLLNDPLYLGMNHERLDGEEYYAFVDEWVEAITGRWPDVLIQFEDFKYPHAYNLLEKYRNKITCFNDDIQSTSSITLAGILASLKVRGRKPEDLHTEKIVCVGAGSAGVGVCEGIIDCMEHQGIVNSREEAYSRIYMLDQFGLIGNPVVGTSENNANGKRAPLDVRQKCYLKRDMADRLTLEEVVKQVKPTVILGLTGFSGVFTEGAIREMAKHQERPVVFPLSNPDTRAECTAEEAFKWTDGRAIFASGSPFKNVLLPNGKVGRTNQCNNSYSFPGIGLGVTVSRSERVIPKMFLETARIIAGLASESQLKEGILFPGVSQLREVALNVGTRVCEVAFEEGLANATFEPGLLLSDIIKNTAYQPEYVPVVYQQHF